jgi:hypothetical protein
MRIAGIWMFWQAILTLFDYAFQILAAFFHLVCFAWNKVKIAEINFVGLTLNEYI